MKQTSLFLVIVSVILLGLSSSCNDPTVIGSDLLSGDQLDIGFTDTSTIRTYNITEDSIITFNPNLLISNNENFPLGIMDDPLFGQSSSSVYMQPTLNFTFPDFDVSGSELDSVVLVLPYNAKGSYGDLEDIYSLEVYQMAEAFPDTSIYSNMDFMIGNRIGSMDYRPAINDSIEIDIPGGDSAVKISPQLRIPLNDNLFDKELFALDSPYSSNVEEFETFFKGIYLSPTSVNKGMPSFNFRGSNAGIRVYYHVDTAFKQYLFPIFSDNVVSGRYEHDYSSSTINIEGNYIGENAPSTDSLLFLQGMSGINFVVEVPYPENLSDKVLNKAEIVFPVQFLSEDDPLNYLPVDQIIVSELLDEGGLRLIDDVILARNREGVDGFMNLFGGDLESDDSYRMIITSHLQDMSRGLVGNKMVVTLFVKSEQASRVVLSGPGNANSPAKLEITFTNF